MSLSEKLALLTNPNPAIDTEDDEDDISTARLTDKGEIDESVSVSTTKLRRHSQILLDDDDNDERYAGKPVSRKGLSSQENESEESDDSAESSDDEDGGLANQNEQDSGSSGNQDEEDSRSSENQDEDDDSDNYEELKTFKNQVSLNNQGKDNNGFTFTDDGDYSKYADDDEEDDMEGGEDSDSGDDLSDEESEGQSDQSQGASDEENEDKGGVQSFSKTNVEDELKKGKATKSQLGLWDSLLEARIRLQKSVVAVNQLPQPGQSGQFNTEGGEDYHQALKQCEVGVKQLLDQFVQLQTMLMLQCPDTKAIVKTGTDSTPKKTPLKADDGDEEIPSDEDMVEEEQDEEAEEQQRQQLKRKLKMADFPGFLAKRHQAFQPYRDETIQKWYDKTRVASGKLGKGFSAFESSALKQIQQILSDKNRLLKRTQLKRSTYRVLGKPEEKTQKDSSDESSDEEKQNNGPLRKNHLKDYDEEIFDDDDFYHQLLRQLIERKTSDVNDPIALSRQWLEIQKLRSKVKKKIDTKASKGRKLRYDVHTKLLNFMAPFETCKWTDQARDDLYSSLFGKRQKAGTEEENTDR